MRAASGAQARSPAEEETDSARLSRELRLEHVQIRELSGMMLRLVDENGDLAGAHVSSETSRAAGTRTRRKKSARSRLTASRAPRRGPCAPAARRARSGRSPASARAGPAPLEGHEPCIPDGLGQKMRGRVALSVVEPHVRHPGVERALDVAGDVGVPRLADRDRGGGVGRRHEQSAVPPSERWRRARPPS